VEWISFQEAAELAGVTVGELCMVLSQSGCVDPPEELRALRRLRRAYTELPPNHPRVRVRAYMAVDSMEFAYGDIVVVSARCVGSLNASHLDREDLIAWLADKSARMMVANDKCEFCGDAIDRDYRLCQRCAHNYRHRHFQDVLR
jgi:uncharacterized paraquat-inducible protein A